MFISTKEVFRTSKLTTYTALLKASTFSGTTDLIKEFLELVKDSVIWHIFAFKMAGALDMRAEIAHQMHEVTKDPAANQILTSILKESIFYHIIC